MTKFTFDCPACGYTSDYELDDPNLPQGCPKCINKEGPRFLIEKFGLKSPKKIVYEMGEDPEENSIALGNLFKSVAEGATIILTSKGNVEERENETRIKLKEDFKTNNIIDIHAKETEEEFIKRAVQSTENLNEWLKEHGEEIIKRQEGVNKLTQQVSKKFEETVHLVKKIKEKSNFEDEEPETDNWEIIKSETINGIELRLVRFVDSLEFFVGKTSFSVKSETRALFEFDALVKYIEEEELCSIDQEILLQNKICENDVSLIRENPYSLMIGEEEISLGPNRNLDKAKIIFGKIYGFLLSIQS